jgi:hypothetical protein
MSLVPAGVARAGEHTPLVAKARVKSMPSAASQSMLGVRISVLP